MAVQGSGTAARPAFKSSYKFALLVNLVIVLSLEAAVRLTESARADLAKLRVNNDRLAGLTLSKDLGWVRTPGFHGAVFDGVTRAFDSRGYFVEDAQRVAGHSRRKVLFFGDSCTFGIGVPPASTFAEVVNRLMPDVDAINLGVPGYTSFQGRKALGEYLNQLDPAAVVVSFNHNDRRAVYPGDEPDSSEHFAHLIQRYDNPLRNANHYLQAIHLSSVFEAVMARAHLLHRPARNFRVDELRPRVSESDYRANLTDIAAQCRRRGIPLIFIVLRDNPLDAGYVDKGIESLQRGDYDAAIGYLWTGATSMKYYSDLALPYLAKAYEAKGDKAAAARFAYSIYPIPAIHGGPPERLDSTYNAIMRQVAAENHVEVVEGAEALARDPYLYIDVVHFNPAGHRIIAELVASRLRKVLGEPTLSAAASH